MPADGSVFGREYFCTPVIKMYCNSKTVTCEGDPASYGRVYLVKGFIAFLYLIAAVTFCLQ